MPDPKLGFPTLQILMRFDSNHDALQNLLGELAKLSYLGKSGIHEINASARERESIQSQEASNRLTRGLRLVILPERLRATIQTISNWLDEFQVKIDIDIQIPPNLEFTPGQSNIYQHENFAPKKHVQLQTDTSEDLAEILVLTERILPSKHTYLQQVSYYIKHFGELTPAAKANLHLLRSALDLSQEEVEELDATALGQQKTLQDKYDYYKQGLSDSTPDQLSDSFWKAMFDRSKDIDLPRQDANFINRKYQEDQEFIRIQKLQQEIDTEKAKKNDEMKRFDSYQAVIRQVMLNGCLTSGLANDELFLIVCQREIKDLAIRILFFKHLIFKTREFEQERKSRKAIFKANSGIEFNKHQLREAQKKYGISEADANAIADILVDRGGFDSFNLSRD